MRNRLSIVMLAAAAMLVPSAAWAAGKNKDAKSKEASAQSASKGPRKDPKGITGISPYREKLNEGTNAFLARDYDKAISLYRQAIEMSPNKPLGHYLMGEALLAAGKLAEARKAWQDASRFSTKDAELHTKALFVLADLYEREKHWEDAARAWQEYRAYAAAQGMGYTQTATEREKVYAKHKDLAAKYAKVKERIAQREADALAKKKH